MRSRCCAAPFAVMAQSEEHAVTRGVPVTSSVVESGDQANPVTSPIAAPVTTFARRVAASTTSSRPPPLTKAMLRESGDHLGGEERLHPMSARSNSERAWTAAGADDLEAGARQVEELPPVG